MENCVAEPEEQPLSAPDDEGPSPPLHCLFSQRVSAASWMLDCNRRVYMPVLLWVVCLFFFSESIANITLWGLAFQNNKERVMDFFPSLLLCPPDGKIKTPIFSSGINEVPLYRLHGWQSERGIGRQAARPSPCAVSVYYGRPTVPRANH